MRCGGASSEVITSDILAKGGADGTIEAVILDVGGFLGIGEKPVAVSFDSLEVMTDEDGAMYAYSSFTEDQLEAATAFDAETYEANREIMLVRPSQRTAHMRLQRAFQPGLPRDYGRRD